MRISGLRVQLRRGVKGCTHGRMGERTQGCGDVGTYKCHVRAYSYVQVRVRIVHMRAARLSQTSARLLSNGRGARNKVTCIPLKYARATAVPALKALQQDIHHLLERSACVGYRSE